MLDNVRYSIIPVDTRALTQDESFYFFKASLGPGEHSNRPDQRSVAFIEEYWRLLPQSDDPLWSEFGCARLYSTQPRVHHVIDTWRILGPAQIIRNPVHPTIPFGTLPTSQAARQRQYPSAKSDSAPDRHDGSPQWIVNMWSLMWGLSRPTPGVDIFVHLCAHEARAMSVCVYTHENAWMYIYTPMYIIRKLHV